MLSVSDGIYVQKTITDNLNLNSKLRRISIFYQRIILFHDKLYLASLNEADNYLMLIS